MARPGVVLRPDARPTLTELYAVACAALPDTLRRLRVPPCDVDDVLHDIVLAAYGALDRFDPELFHDGTNDPESALEAWLGGIAWRLTTRYRERGHRRHELPSGDGANLPMDPGGDGLSAEQIVARDQRRRLLGRLLQALRPERAEVLLMHYLLEMTVPAIAAKLGINTGTVASRISRGRADFVVAARRLREDERNLLEKGMLFIPFGRGGPVEEPRRPREHAPDRPARGLTFATCAPVALAVATLAMFGIGRAATAAPPPIAGIHEVAEPDFDTPSTSAAAPTATSPAPPASATPPRPARTVEGPAVNGAGSVSLELLLLNSARSALRGGAHERAIASLAAHRRQFPAGVLARQREQIEHDLLLEKARRSVRATSAQTR